MDNVKLQTIWSNNCAYSNILLVWVNLLQNMEKKFLQIQQKHTTNSFVTNTEQIRKAKNNFLLIIAIIGLCITIRLNNDTGLVRGNESTLQPYFDVPAHQTVSSLKIARLV
jgi:hypothetical protein